MFSPTSRYYSIETKKFSLKGQEVLFIRRRFLPDATATGVKHLVTEGERLDNITAQYLGDPEQFWQLCDAENAMHPRELTETIGRRLHIPLSGTGE